MLVGSIVTVCFIIVPLFMGSDDALDPRRFSLFGMRNRELSFGLALAVFIGIPAVALAITLVGFIVTWTRGFGETVLAVIAAVLALVTLHDALPRLHLTREPLPRHQAGHER